MEAQLFLGLTFTFLALLAACFLLFRCKCSGTLSAARLHRTDQDEVASPLQPAEGAPTKESKNSKKQKTPAKATHTPAAASRNADHQQMSAAAQELFVDYVKGVNKHADCIAIAPHAPLIATTTADAKVHVALDSSSTYFYNFREDTFSALDFWCKEQQKEGSAVVCGAMATDGRMVCFEVKYEQKKITGMSELHRSHKPLQKGVVAQLVASKGPWVITRSEGDDTEIRVHSYGGDLLASVDTKQVQNLQLSVSADGCFFGCAAWAPGVKVFEVKAKGGSFQKVEKAMDIRSSQGLTAFAISADRSRAATLEKSGRLSIWNIDVRHNAGEETKLLHQTTAPVSSSASSSLQFSLDGSLLVLASGADLHFFLAASLEKFKTVEHAASQPLQHVLVAPNNKFLLLCAEGSRPVIWRLPKP